MAPLQSIPRFLVTEPPALDLVNTRLLLAGVWVDLLEHSETCSEWLTAEADRLGISATKAAICSAEVAVAIRDVRENVAVAIDPASHGKKPPARALAGLNGAIRAAPVVPLARWDGTTVVATTDRAGPLAARLAAGFAEAAVELLADPAIRKVRRCDAPNCSVLFLARHPNRRWCTPTICGNRARVARHYRRHKPGQVVASP